MVRTSLGMAGRPMGYLDMICPSRVDLIPKISYLEAVDGPSVL